MQPNSQEHQNEILRERAKHQAVLMDIQALLMTKPGKNFIKYLFAEFNVGEMPTLGLTGEMLYEQLGFHRSGNAIFKIVAQANSEMAGLLLGQIEKEKYDQALHDSR